MGKVFFSRCQPLRRPGIAMVRHQEVSKLLRVQVLLIPVVVHGVVERLFRIAGRHPADDDPQIRHAVKLLGKASTQQLAAVEGILAHCHERHVSTKTKSMTELIGSYHQVEHGKRVMDNKLHGTAQQQAKALIAKG